MPKPTKTGTADVVGQVAAKLIQQGHAPYAVAHSMFSVAYFMLAGLHGSKEPLRVACNLDEIMRLGRLDDELESGAQ